MPKVVWTVEAVLSDDFFEEAEARLALKPLIEALAEGMKDIPGVDATISMNGGTTTKRDAQPTDKPRGKPGRKPGYSPKSKQSNGDSDGAFSQGRSLATPPASGLPWDDATPAKEA